MLVQQMYPYVVVQIMHNVEQGNVVFLMDSADLVVEMESLIREKTV